MIYLPFLGGTADPCIVVLLSHMDAYPLVNEVSAYPISTSVLYEVDTGLKQFGAASLRAKAATTFRTSRNADYTGAAGGGVECTNGKFTIEYRFRRQGGSGIADGATLWTNDVTMQFSGGAELTFTAHNHTHVGPGNGVGYLVTMNDGASGYDEHYFQDYTWTGDDFHAIALSVDGGALRVLFDGVTLETHTLTASIPADARLEYISFGNLLDTERMDEIRVMVNRAAYTADYTPATEAFSTTDCDDTGTPSYYGDTILILNCEQANGSTTFIDTSPIGHTVGASGGTSITDEFAVFDGVDNMLRLTDATEWDFGTQDFTIEVVADFASLPAGIWGLIMNRSPGPSSPDTGFILYGQGDDLWVTVYEPPATPSGPAVILWGHTAANVMTTGLHHICLQRSGSTFVLSLDGVSVGTATDSAAVGFNPDFDIQIGNDESATGRFFDGKMRVRVTKGIARYTFPFTPSYDQWPDPT